MEPVRLAWPGGEHEFMLPLGRLRALQGNCNAGPEEIFNRLRLGSWRVDDVIETVRHGLIGGGMPEKEAGPLVTTVVEQGALTPLKLTAISILGHALLGPEDDPAGEPDGVETPAPENGDSRKSTATAP